MVLHPVQRHATLLTTACTVEFTGLAEFCCGSRQIIPACFPVSATFASRVKPGFFMPGTNEKGKVKR